MLSFILDVLAALAAGIVTVLIGVTILIVMFSKEDDDDRL